MDPLALAVGPVVDDQHVVVCYQSVDQVRTNEAGTPGDDDSLVLQVQSATAAPSSKAVGIPG
nr:hypothetical protein [Halomicroarcula salinisoli]